VPSEPIDLEGSAVKGSPSATVAIVEFSDFQCPFCARHARETLPTLDVEYVQTGRVLVAFRHLPLQNHPLAAKAAQAGTCADDQAKFWPMHQRLFEASPTVDDKRIELIVDLIGLDKPKFMDCYRGDLPKRVSEDQALAKRLGVSATPAFFVGKVLPGRKVKISKVVPGAMPLQQFRDLLNGLVR
jgi:protein-disulfide isomerase